MAKPSLTYKEKLQALRARMKDHGLDGYIIPRSDEYQGEFVAPYAERLKWLTGFTGSGGAALVFAKKAIVLTDGRYLIQVNAQVDNAVFDTGEYVKKPTAKWILDYTKPQNIIGYDPFLHTPKQIADLEKECKPRGVILKPIKSNLIDEIWSDQPTKPVGQVTIFPKEIAGKSSQDKIKDVVTIINNNNAQALIIALPDSIAWLLNVRGSDIDYIPSVLSYLLVTHRGNIRWFVDPEKIDAKTRKALGKKVTICAPQDMNLQFMALAQASSEKNRPILMDMRYTPIQIKSMLENRGATTKDFQDPTIKPKAQKTPSEIAAIRKAHIHDGAALVKFLKWLDENGVGESEVSASNKLESFRAQSPAFKGNSFPTIAGFASNGAIVHYRADDQTNAIMESGNMLLIDSGGQYASGDIYGTTDITRTIAIGEPSPKMRAHNTRVLKGHIGIATAKFPIGTIGAQIDTLARQHLWDVGLNFAHGTGHGVGCYLAVHEEAASISPRGQVPFEEGMLISNEPGYYKEDAYGIRIENLVLVRKKQDMLSFETISFAPIDRNLIDKGMLSKDEVAWLDAYHQQTYDILVPHLSSDEQSWLLSRTRPI